MKRLSLFCTFVAVGAVMATYTGRVHAYADDKAEITALEQRVMDGFKSKDVNKIMSCYAPDESLFVFDVVPPREYVGANAYRKDWEELFAQFPGPVDARMSHLNITTDGTFGYAHLIVYSAMTDKNGKKMESNVRTTDVFRKANGKWLIVHEHNSVPVDLATGKADLMAKP